MVTLGLQSPGIKGGVKNSVHADAHLHISFEHPSFNAPNDFIVVYNHLANVAMKPNQYQTHLELNPFC
jgi:hypothetical protein